MSTIDGTIQAQSPTIVGKLRIMLVATLVAGIVGGFGLGRVTYRGGSTVAPDWAVPANTGPGHVPRHWVTEAGLGCSPLGSRPVRCPEAWASLVKEASA
jgi:hypothetical protein